MCPGGGKERPLLESLWNDGQGLGESLLALDGAVDDGSENWLHLGGHTLGEEGEGLVPHHHTLEDIGHALHLLVEVIVW